MEKSAAECLARFRFMVAPLFLVCVLFKHLIVCFDFLVLYMLLYFGIIDKIIYLSNQLWNYSACLRILLHRCSWPRLPLDEIKPPHLELGGFVSVPKMLRWSAWWVFSTLTNLMGGKLMVKKHNLHKCTCPFLLF